VGETITEHLRAGRYEEAIPLLETTLRLEPNDLNSLTNPGMVYSDLGRLEEARQLLERAVELDPADANARVALGVALHATCQATATPAQRQPCHASASPQRQPWASTPSASAGGPTPGPSQPAASGSICGSCVAITPREQLHRRRLQRPA
jgi:tetratricopeptide (TPR) repeat protein